MGANLIQGIHYHLLCFPPQGTLPALYGNLAPTLTYLDLSQNWLSVGGHLLVRLWTIGRQ